jgi:hypothetical protein
MRLWLLKRIRGERDLIYDCNDGFVIRAESSTDARLIASQQFGDEGPNVWLSNDTSRCEELLQSGEPGVILIDFHAG